jgi:hypothetical protein
MKMEMGVVIFIVVCVVGWFLLDEIFAYFIRNREDD